MKSKRGIKRRLKGLWRDVRGVAASHGNAMLFFYVVVKLASQTPLTLWMLRTFCRGKLLVRTRILGSWMYLNLLDPGISYQLLVNGVREVAHVEQVKQGISAGMKGLEVGANIGYYVLLECQLIGPEGQVFCIEPAPDNVSLLRKNIAANGYDNRASSFQYLAGGENGSGKLFLSSAANSHSIAATGESGERSLRLPMVTIDHFLATKSIDPSGIDFLRMDIEGYEVIVLQHINTLLTHRTKPLKLFIELHPASYYHWGWTLEKLLDYLTTELGFVITSAVQESIRDVQGRLTDRIIQVASASELSRKYREWERTGPQTGIWVSFELPPSSQ